jgi:glucose-1-phosphate cytidylyltransferase
MHVYGTIFMKKSPKLPPNKDISVVIFCGGKGTRLKEETELIPKPMVRIGDKPILWHIMKIYYAQGFRNFILLLGYKGEKIKDYFSNYMLYASDLTLSHDSWGTKANYHKKPAEDWNITFVETGLDTMTGGRLKKIESFIRAPFFMLTYGDGVANVKMDDLLKTHSEKGALVTITGVHPPARFGELHIDDGRVVAFNEKPKTDALINGGFFVVDRKVFKHIPKGDEINFEMDVLPTLAKNSRMAAHHHADYWQCMDTIRDTEVLNERWTKGNAPWKVW